MYLGSRYYLSGKERNHTVLITPDMQPQSAPLVFDNKKILSITYPAYDAEIDGYLVYENSAKKVQKYDLTLSLCNDLLDAGSRDFKGNIPGTTFSAFLSQRKLHRLDKEDGTSDENTLGKAPNYNFQTFLNSYRYLYESIDSDGAFVLYAKNDTDFYVDAFSMNLLKENSLAQLTDTDPADFNKTPKTTTAADTA